MQTPIIFTPLPVDATQRGELEKLFTSRAFILLKEMVAARIISAQVESANAMLYSQNNEAAKDKADILIAKARVWTEALDLLDDMGRSEQEWFTAKLDYKTK